MARSLSHIFSHTTRVYVVEHSLLIRAMLDTLLGTRKDICVVGMAASGADALDEITALLPDVVLIDLAMLDVDGFALLDHLAHHWHSMRAIIVTPEGRGGDYLCAEGLAHGAGACFSRAALATCGQELVTLLHELHEGRVHPSWHQGGAVTLPARDHHRHDKPSPPLI
jgi:chemotaxis response regulator CheB